MPQDFEPPSSMRPTTNHLQGRNAMGWAVAFFAVLALVFAAFAVAGLLGADGLGLVDSGLAVLLAAAALTAERERRKLRR